MTGCQVFLEDYIGIVIGPMAYEILAMQPKDDNPISDLHFVVNCAALDYGFSMTVRPIDCRWSVQSC